MAGDGRLADGHWPVAELITLVRDRKGAVHAPKSVDFADALPVTGLRKLNKKVIPVRFWQAQQRAANW